MAIEELRSSRMMSHLLEALGRGDDIRHYGRPTFAMIARHFLSVRDASRRFPSVGAMGAFAQVVTTSTCFSVVFGENDAL